MNGFISMIGVYCIYAVLFHIGVTFFLFKIFFFSFLGTSGSDCWKVCDDFEKILGVRMNYVKKYVDNKPDLELQCLFAMQALVVEYQFPNSKY